MIACFYPHVWVMAHDAAVDYCRGDCVEAVAALIEICPDDQIHVLRASHREWPETVVGTAIVILRFSVAVPVSYRHPDMFAVFTAIL